MIRKVVEKPGSTNDQRAETRVLLVEDNVADARLIREMLHEPGNDRFVLETVDRLSDAITCIREAPFDIVLLDLGLPDSQGLETLKTFLESAVEIPVIVLSGLADDAISLQAVEGGAQDYLVKGKIDGHLLLRAIRYAIGRKRQEVDLFRAKYLLERTISSMYEAVLVINPPGSTIVACNPSVKRVFGYEVEEVMGKDTELLHVDRVMYEEFGRISEQALKETGVFRTEYRMKRKDGAVIQTEITLTAILEKGDRLPGAVGVVRDITDRKRAEEEKLSLLRQLQTAQRMESVGTLAGGIAHDFNNVLTGILGYSELLRQRIAGDPKALGDLDEISRAGEQAAKLTRQLLTFARRQVYEPVNLYLCDAVKDLKKFFVMVAGEQIEVRTLLAADTPIIRADRGQIEQVLMNLIVNARDAMPQGGKLFVEIGGVTLEEEYVKEHQYIKKGRYALLTVSDTGTGMDEATREHVFEPFFTTKAPDKGTGLGLSVVYGIVKQHNGYIHVYSEPGKGSAFKVYFPAVEGSPDVLVSVKSEPIRGGSETILLAEDEEAILKLAWRILKDIGYTVLTATNGEEAVETFRRHRDKISLAVLDVVMPKMGGKDAYEAMRKENPGLKVIFMSGYSGDAVHEAFIIRSDTPFMGKPFSISTLAMKVRKVLDGK